MWGYSFLILIWFILVNWLFSLSYSSYTAGSAFCNAEVLNIDLSAVDTVILSHGHYDHSGGILPFSKLNHTAQIIIRTVRS